MTGALPTTNLPKSVRKQIEAANKLAAEISNAVQGGTPAPAKEEGQPAPAAADAAPPKGGDPSSQPAPASKEAPAASSPAPAPQPEPPKVEDFQQKYNVLRGKYDAEVPRLHAQIHDLTDAVRDLRQQLSNVQAEAEMLKAARGKPADAGATGEVSPDEIRQFGPDLHDFIRRTAASVAASQVAEVKQTVESKLKRTDEVVAHVADTTAKTAREKLLEQLTAAVPGWSEQNTDPAFLQWLEGEDMFSGEKRGKLLTQAYRRNDAQRVIAFFTGFQRENAAASSPPSASAAPAQQEPPAQNAGPQRKLDDFVAPGTPKTGSAGAPDGSGKRVWTRASIAAFYRKRTDLLKRGKPLPPDLVKQEQDLQSAMRDGRIAN